MIATQQGDEYHDLAAARQQAASIMVSGTSSSMEMNEAIAPTMSFNECGTESIELTVSFEDSTTSGFADPPITTDTNPAPSSKSSITDTIMQLKSSNKRRGSGGTDSTGGGPTTAAEIPAIQPLAPDVAKEYYNVITTSAMMGNVPRLFSSDAANNYYHAMSTRNLLNDDSFKARSSKTSWIFGGRKKSKEGETVQQEEEKKSLIGEVGAEKSDADDLIHVEVDEGKVIDGTDAGGSVHDDTASSTKPAGTFKKLVIDKLSITKSSDSYERLSDGENIDNCVDENACEEVAVETVTSSSCGSSDSTVLSGNSSNSLRHSGLNDVEEVVTDTIDSNTDINGEEIVLEVVNESEDDTIERSRSPASKSGNSFEGNSQDHDINQSMDSSVDVVATTTSAMTLDELLVQAVAASSTPEDVARYILDYEIDSDRSSNQSRDSRQRFANDHEHLEMLLAEALVASTTPEDVARFLLERDWSTSGSKTKLATKEDPKEVVVTSETSAEIIATEFPTNEIPETQSWGKKSNGLSKKLRSVRSMSPSLFKKKDTVKEANVNEAIGLNNDTTVSSNDNKCLDDSNHQLKIPDSTESNNSASIESIVGHAAASPATTLDELLSEAVAVATTPEDVARYILQNRAGLDALGNTSGKHDETEENVAAAKAESSAGVVKTNSPADLSQAMSWSDKKNPVSTKLRSVRSMSPSILHHSTKTTSSAREPTKTATIEPIPSSPNDTSPVFGSSAEGQRECIDSSAIMKCVSFDKQVVEKDDVKRSKTIQSLALPPLPPRPQQTKATDIKEPNAHHVVTTSSDDDGSVECSFVADDMMTLKSAPSCGGCSIKTEYTSKRSNLNVEGNLPAQMVSCATVPTTLVDIEPSVGHDVCDKADKVPTVESGIDLAPISAEQTSKSIADEGNPNAKPDVINVSLSSLMSSTSKNDEKDAATIATCDKTQETTASTVDENEYAVLYGPVLIDTTPKFCVDPKAIAEEFISDLKSVQSSVKNMFASFTSRKGNNIAAKETSHHEQSKKDDSKDDDESVISWSHFLTSK